jgi:hypothetical protein
VAGTIIVDRLESDASYASSINVASPLVVSNTISLGSAAAITGNVNIDSGLIFVDAINNRVGIGGLTNPAAALDITGSVFVRGSTNPGNATNRVVIDYNGNSGVANFSANSTSGDTQINFATSKSGSNANRLNISADGYITTPNQPAFYVVGSNGSYTVSSDSAVEVPMNTILTNIGSHFNATTFRFTAPVAGVYLFSISATPSSTGTGVPFFLLRNGTSLFGSSSYTEAFSYNSTGGYHTTSSRTIVVSLSVNDFISVGAIRYNSSSQTFDLTRCSIMGYFLG